MPHASTNTTAWMQRHQIGIYLAALAVGGVTAGAAPAAADVFAVLITPILAALLYTTFVQVPVNKLVHGLRDKRFVAAVLIVNFALVPLVVAALWGFLPPSDAIRVGVLLVLLTPCIDYVVAFTQLAGGASRTLLAATPLLLVTQMLLLPVFMWLFLGRSAVDAIEVGPFVTAFVTMIVIPLALAWATQTWSARHMAGQKVACAADNATVPLMAATLAVVVASQAPKLDGAATLIGTVAPVFAAFLLIMAAVGWAVARLLRLSAATGRAVVFSGATRNSLVVLPLALALPDHLAAAAIVVVTQTLVEIVGMIAYIALVPALLPADAHASTLRRIRGCVTLLTGNHQPQRQIDQKLRPRQYTRHHKNQSHNHARDTEPVGQAGTHPRDHPAILWPLQLRHGALLRLHQASIRPLPLKHARQTAPRHRGYPLIWPFMIQAPRQSRKHSPTHTSTTTSRCWSRAHHANHPPR